MVRHEKRKVRGGEKQYEGEGRMQPRLEVN